MPAVCEPLFPDAAIEPSSVRRHRHADAVRQRGARHAAGCLHPFGSDLRDTRPPRPIPMLAWRVNLGGNAQPRPRPGRPCRDARCCSSSTADAYGQSVQARRGAWTRRAALNPMATPTAPRRLPPTSPWGRWPGTACTSSGPARSTTPGRASPTSFVVGGLRAASGPDRGRVADAPELQVGAARSRFATFWTCAMFAVPTHCACNIAT